MNLDGKVAIVTGGAVRVGRALVLALADQGVRICLHYGRSASDAAETVSQICTSGGAASSIQADLQSPAAAARAIVDHAYDAFGQADFLVNSAANFEDGCLANTTEEMWERSFAVNLKAPFFLCQYFAARLPADKRAHIVNIVDRRALRPGSDHLAYTLTKSALATLTLSLAQHLAPNVQVNAIAAGAILPPPGQDDTYLDRLVPKIPLRRHGTPDQVADALRFLLRSDFTTGDILRITGGEEL